MLQDALLHLFQPIVVGVQTLAGCGDAGIVFRLFIPRQRHEGLEIVDLHVIVGRLVADASKFLQFAVKDFSFLSDNSCRVGFFAQALGIRTFVFAQFLADVLHLLLQEEVFLLLVQFGACAVLDIALEGGKLYFTVEQFEQLVGSLLDVAFLHERQFLRHLDGQVRGDEIDQENGVVHVANGKEHALRGVLRQFGQTAHGVFYLVGHGGKLLVVLCGQFLLHLKHLAAQVRLLARHGGEHDAVETLQDGRAVAVGQFDTAYHLGQHADVVEVGKLRHIDVGILLAEHADILVRLHRLVNEHTR